MLHNARMTYTAELSRIQTEARKLRITYEEICDEADICRTTFHRWRTGRFAPQQATYARLVKAFETLKAKKATRRSDAVRPVRRTGGGK